MPDNGSKEESPSFFIFYFSSPVNMLVKSILSRELSISTGRARVCEVIKITVLFYFLEVLKRSCIAEASNICRVFLYMKENITVYYANAVIMPHWKTSNFL